MYSQEPLSPDSYVDPAVFDGALERSAELLEVRLARFAAEQAQGQSHYSLYLAMQDGRHHTAARQPSSLDRYNAVALWLYLVGRRLLFGC